MEFSFSPLVSITSLMTSIVLSISSPAFAQSTPLLVEISRIEGGQESPPRGSVEIDTSGLEDAEEAVKRLINDRANSIFRELEFLIARDQNDLVVSIIVQRARASKHELNYQASLKATVEGKLVDSGQAIVECLMCTEGELINKIAASLRTILQSWRDQQAETSDSSLSKVDTVPPATLHPDPAEVDNKLAAEVLLPPPPVQPPVQSRRRLRGLGWGGIGLGILGLGASAAGGTLVGLGTPKHPNDPAKKINYERAGLPILLSGAGVLVSGIVMLIVDRVKARRYRSAS